jgi:UDP-N-acetylmuramoylalanine--D-glutamate ligase
VSVGGVTATPGWLTAPGEAIPWPELSVCVCGARTAGEAVALRLAERGATVTVLDRGNDERIDASSARLQAAGVRVLLGADAETPAGLPADADLVIVSPGWRPDHPVLRAAAAAGVPVWGDVELAFRFSSQLPWLVVTGTNGKTTTTGMLAAILTAAGLSAEAAGNIGRPLIDAVLATGLDGSPAYQVLAVELSSFQLYWTSTVVPHAAAILNVAPDHLDWHGGLDAYAAAKELVWRSPDTVAVGNADDELVAGMLARAPGLRVNFSLRDVDFGSWTQHDGQLVDPAGTPVLPIDQLATTGSHNVANALAAAALAASFGVPTTAIAVGLAGYAPGAHRNVLVAERSGVSFVNDSKATNPHAAAASLLAYPSVVWVAGGLNKDLPFDDLVIAVRDRLRAVVLIGACADEVAAALSRHAPQVPVIGATTLENAVGQAAGLARSGDTVVLAPAAASMDMFRDYAERGDRFAAAARALPGAARRE